MSTAKILVVEDEYIVAMALEKSLEHMGYVVAATADSGRAAIEKASETRPDLVLMDIRLKGPMDGIEAGATIHTRFDLPLVYTTAYADEDTLQRARITEPYGYIIKPFDDRDLRTAIEIALHRHRADKKVRDSEQRFSTTLASIADAVVAADADGSVSFMNPAAEALTGWHQSDALGKKMSSALWVVDEDGHMVAEKTVRKVLRAGGAFSLANHILITQAGTEVPVDCTVAPIRNGQGAISGVVMAVRDITGIRRADEEKHSLQGQLRQAQKMEAVGLLAGGVAHDFNNLLTVIEGNAQLGMMQLRPDDRGYEEFETIERTAEQAAHLTRQLLAFSRRQILQPRQLDLNQLVRTFTQLLERVMGANIRLHLDLAPKCGAVFADPQALQQVLMNLVVNAKDAMPEGGELRILTRVLKADAAYRRTHPAATAHEYVRLTVSDTGTGMDDSTLKRLFEPFFTTKEVGKGTGLGLPVVYGIVKQHDGWIDVNSSPGKGPRFDIYLPVCGSAPQASRPQEEEAPAVVGGHETILLAEDQPGVREFGRRVLEELGYTVLLACDGAEAVKLFASRHPRVNLVILDAVMPKASGRKAWESMRALDGDTPVLYITGYSEELSGLSAEAQGGVRVLRKPFGAVELGLTVRGILDSATPSPAPDARVKARSAPATRQKVADDWPWRRAPARAAKIARGRR
jgi:two-component system cell cycle sensor histidine kinase/response regulator CckA